MGGRESRLGSARLPCLSTVNLVNFQRRLSTTHRPSCLVSSSLQQVFAHGEKFLTKQLSHSRLTAFVLKCKQSYTLQGGFRSARPLKFSNTVLSALPAFAAPYTLFWAVPRQVFFGGVRGSVPESSTSTCWSASTADYLWLCCIVNFKQAQIESLQHLVVNMVAATFGKWAKWGNYCRFDTFFFLGCIFNLIVKLGA